MAKRGAGGASCTWPKASEQDIASAIPARPIRNLPPLIWRCYGFACWFCRGGNCPMPPSGKLRQENREIELQDRPFADIREAEGVLLAHRPGHPVAEFAHVPGDRVGAVGLRAHLSDAACVHLGQACPLQER